MDKQFIKILDELRAIAQLGLNYTRDNYDRERYERLMCIATKAYSDVCEIDEVTIKQLFNKELGYITPKVGVNGIISIDNKVLLERRADDNKWGVPGGWAEVGESPQESLIREFKEETGLDIEVGNIIDVFTQRPGDYGIPHSSHHLLFSCKVIGGELKKSFESNELGYYEYEKLVGWHRDHFEMVDRAKKSAKLKCI